MKFSREIADNEARRIKVMGLEGPRRLDLLSQIRSRLPGVPVEELKRSRSIPQPFSLIVNNVAIRAADFFTSTELNGGVPIVSLGSPEEMVAALSRLSEKALALRSFSLSSLGPVFIVKVKRPPPKFGEPSDEQHYDHQLVVFISVSPDGKIANGKIDLAKIYEGLAHEGYAWDGNRIDKNGLLVNCPIRVVRRLKDALDKRLEAAKLTALGVLSYEMVYGSTCDLFNPDKNSRKFRPFSDFFKQRLCLGGLLYGDQWSLHYDWDCGRPAGVDSSQDPGSYAVAFTRPIDWRLDLAELTQGWEISTLRSLVDCTPSAKYEILAALDPSTREALQ